MKRKIYLTNNQEEITKRTKNREDRFYKNMEVEWADAKANYYITDDGEEILKINGLEVMAEFQKPYMAKLAKIVTSKGGNILSVGFGLGLIDSYIEKIREENKINTHHIIELNNDVVKRAKKWKKQQRHSSKIIIHQGNWKEVIKNLNIEFDGIIYDAYPLKKEDLCRDFIPFLESLIEFKLIRENKEVITFFFDSSEGFGDDFIQYSKELGINEMTYEKVKIELPKNRQSETWMKDYFLAPTLTKVKYKTPIN